MKRSDPLQEKIAGYLRRNVPAERVRHILGVAALAETLALKHGLDPRKARLAALCHDLARRWNDRALVRYVRRHGLRLRHREWTCRRQPSLLHSHVGAHLAKTLFGIRDRGVLSAVAKHSLGDVRMSSFDLLIYVADLLAPDRRFKEADSLRRLARRDLRAAFREGLKVKLGYVVQNQGEIHPQSLDVWNAFASRGTKK